MITRSRARDLTLLAWATAWSINVCTGLQSSGGSQHLASATASFAEGSEEARRRKPLLFMGVYTAPTEEGRKRRQEIRETYFTHKQLQKGGLVQAKFIVGWPKNKDFEAQALMQELKDRPQDFVQVPVMEDYKNLTKKTMEFMRWFAKNSKAKYMLKMDDDTYPHVDHILSYLQEETIEYLHMGLMFPCAPVLKMTKWAENPSIWNHSFFPRYMQGSGYFLSAALAKNIAEEHYEINIRRMLNNEDAAVGLWTEMERWSDPNIEIEQRNIAATLTGCQSDDLLSMNNQIGYMKCYWRRYLRGEQDVCCYGPLDNLRQSLLQTTARVRAKTRVQERSKALQFAGVGCYAE